MNHDFERIYDLIGGVKDELSEMKVTLAENTVIMKEHHKRSTRLETIVEAMKKPLEAITTKVLALDKDIVAIGAVMKPVTSHVEKIDKILIRFSAVPMIMKLLLFLFGFATSGLGCYSLYVKFFVK